VNPVVARRIAALAWLCTGLPAWAQGQAEHQADLVARGANIYLFGRLADGTALLGEREAGRPPARGPDAACVNCHKHSGLGAVEGRMRIPPITGRFLTPPHSLRADAPDLPYVETIRGGRKDYTDVSTARAIREGIDADGRTMSTLMPHFALGDADMNALIAYLKSLDRAVEPGVTDKVLHFATVITPDADPAKREATLAVLRQFVKDKNDKAFNIGPSAPIRFSGRAMVGKMLLIVPRRWELHVWELTGKPETWGAQLDASFAHDPVLAVISGAGGNDWSPVHQFCERRAVPCIFPNVDLPVDRPDDFYSVYFSGGLELEANLIAARIAQSNGTHRTVVRQLYRSGGIGAGAAAALERALTERGLAVAGEALPAIPTSGDVTSALRNAGGADTLVLWLNAADIAALGEVPAQLRQVFVSGRMGGFEQMPLPSAWRAKSLIAYPIELPDKRSVAVRYAQDWLRVRAIPLTDAPVQTDTWLACSILTETLNEILDAFIPEYLVERVQDDLEHRFITGNYPHLAIGEHQRFASKGGYVVRFADATGSKVVPIGGWTVP
jgi:hypothetical protein